MWIGSEVDKRNRLQPDSLNGSRVRIPFYSFKIMYIISLLNLFQEWGKIINRSLGKIAKLVNAADCKSAPIGFGGSSPSLSIVF